MKFFLTPMSHSNPVGLLNYIKALKLKMMLLKYVMSFNVIFAIDLASEYDLKQQGAVSINILKIYMQNFYLHEVVSNLCYWRFFL